MGTSYRSIEEWREHLLDHGYSGDQIGDILRGWEADNARLKTKLALLEPVYQAAVKIFEKSLIVKGGPDDYHQQMALRDAVTAVTAARENGDGDERTA